MFDGRAFVLAEQLNNLGLTPRDALFAPPVVVHHGTPGDGQLMVLAPALAGPPSSQAAARPVPVVHNAFRGHEARRNVFNGRPFMLAEQLNNLGLTPSDALFAPPVAVHHGTPGDGQLMVQAPALAGPPSSQAAARPVPVVHNAVRGHEARGNVLESLLNVQHNIQHITRAYQECRDTLSSIENALAQVDLAWYMAHHPHDRLRVAHVLAAAGVNNHDVVQQKLQIVEQHIQEFVDAVNISISLGVADLHQERDDYLANVLEQHPDLRRFLEDTTENPPPTQNTPLGKSPKLPGPSDVTSGAPSTPFST